VNESDTDIEKKQKNVFRAFSEWFLRERSVRYILYGKMKDKKKYIKYKNNVLLYYVRHPEQFKSNQRPATYP